MSLHAALAISEIPEATPVIYVKLDVLHVNSMLLTVHLANPQEVVTTSNPLTAMNV